MTKRTGSRASVAIQGATTCCQTVKLGRLFAAHVTRQGEIGHHIENNHREGRDRFEEAEDGIGLQEQANQQDRDDACYLDKGNRKRWRQMPGVDALKTGGKRARATHGVHHARRSVGACQADANGTIDYGEDDKPPNSAPQRMAKNIVRDLDWRRRRPYLRCPSRSSWRTK